MSDLLLDRRLATAPGGSTVNSVARTLTLTVLRRLDGRRKGIVVQFLAEAHLIDYDPAISGPLGVSESPKVSLFRADLRKLTFEDPPLFGTGLNLMGADLSKASMDNVQMTANLKRATLRDADMRRVVLGGSLESADLSGADLSGATLTTVTLDKACVTGARLVNVHFRAATDFGRMAGYGVDLSGARLIRADLSPDQARGCEERRRGATGGRLPRNWNVDDLEVGDDEVARWCRRASPPG